MSRQIFMILLTAMMVLQGCGESYEKSDLVFVKRKYDNIYVIVYSRGSGVFETATFYYFVSDMKSFNQYVGSCDEVGRVLVKVNNDSTFYVALYSNAIGNEPYETVNYDIGKLESNGHFDKSLAEAKLYLKR